MSIAGLTLRTREALSESSWPPAGARWLLNKLAGACAEMGVMGLGLLEEPRPRNPSNTNPPVLLSAADRVIQTIIAEDSQSELKTAPRPLAYRAFPATLFT